MEKCFKLLIANDNSEESNLISEKLTSDKNLYAVDVTSNGKEAIDLILSNEYDLVVVDLVLSEIDGFEVIEKIKETNLKTKMQILFLNKQTNNLQCLLK